MNKYQDINKVIYGKPTAILLLGKAHTEIETRTFKWLEDVANEEIKHLFFPSIVSDALTSDILNISSLE